MREHEGALATAGRSVLQAQPFSVLLGAQLLRLEQGEAVLRLALRHELMQQNGYAHGGVLCYLADNALTFAAGSLLGEDVVTAELKINYLRPAKGHELVAHAVTLHAGHNQAVCRCDVFEQDGRGASRLCATAQGTICRRAATRSQPSSNQT